MKNHDSQYLRIAKIISENSKAKKKKVGCVVVKDLSIVSDGYNGTPSGFDNTCEDEQGNTKYIVLHAEANAITKLAKSTNSSIGSTLYCTISPCVECAKLIIQSGIIRVVFMDNYRDLRGLMELRKAGIEVEKINF